MSPEYIFIMMNPKRILITRTDRLGDVVLSTPVIRAMRRAYPDAYIAFMVRPKNKDIVLNNPDLDEVIIYDKYGEYKGFWKTFLFALSLKKKKFDTAVALHPTNRAHIIMFLAGIPVRIGYDKKMSWLLTKKIPHSKQLGDKHEVDYNFDLLKDAGFKLADIDRMPYIVVSKEDEKMVDAIKKSAGVQREMIAFHIGASCKSKMWSVERFARTADILCGRYKCDIVLVGGDETESLSEKMISNMKNKAVDLTGTLLLGEFAELLSRCKLFISNDSGPVHVGVAVGVPTIVIFGRKDPGLSPERWGPLGPRDTVLHNPPECEVCLAHKCDKNFLCLDNVTVEDVVAAAEEMMGSAQSA